MNKNNEIIKKFKENLPEKIPESVILRVVKTCIERDSQRLLNDDVKIFYGESKHTFFQFEGSRFINVLTEDELPMSWIFDETGELIAT